MKSGLEKALDELQVAFSLASREEGYGRAIASKIQSAQREIRKVLEG